MAKDGKYVVIGMGTFGYQVAHTLKSRKADVVVIDKDIRRIHEAQAEGFRYAVQLDSTDPVSLARFVQTTDHAIIAMGESFEANILTIGILKELGVEKIYARAVSDIQTKILKQLGVSEILFPEKQAGERFALKVLFEGVLFMEEYQAGIFIGEVKVPEKFFGKNILELQIRNEYQINIIAIKELGSKESGGKDPSRDVIHPIGFERIQLTEGHSMIVVGKEEQIEKFILESN